MPKPKEFVQNKSATKHTLESRSWRDCKRARNKVLAAEPTSERRSREENGERDFEIPPVPPPKLYFALAIPPATQANPVFITPGIYISYFIVM